VSVKKRILILTDGTEKVAEMAGKIAGALKSSKPLIKTASEFAGTDLLPADVLFIGCGEPSPTSFSYIDEMLHHINLAGRSCGIFSSSKKAVQYLKTLLKPSEISIDAESLTTAIPADVKKWTDRVLSGKK